MSQQKDQDDSSLLMIDSNDSKEAQTGANGNTEIVTKTINGTVWAVN